jgi:hypothetical protein
MEVEVMRVRFFYEKDWMGGVVVKVVVVVVVMAVVMVMCWDVVGGEGWHGGMSSSLFIRRR